MSTDTPASWEQIIGKCRRLLARWLKESAESHQVVAELLESLEEMDRLYRGGVGATLPMRRKTSSDSKPGTRFVVERTHRGMFLAEHFSAKRLPFRCPEHVYNLVVTELEKVDAAVSIDAILQDVRRKADIPISDYLVRVCIRYWLSTKPPLIEKIRARYRPLNAAQFGRAARREWKKLADEAK